MTTDQTRPSDGDHDASVVPLWPERSADPGTAPAGPTHLWITLDPSGGEPAVRVLQGPRARPLPATGVTSDEPGESGVMTSAEAPRIAPGEPLAVALQRISLELLDHAIRDLSDPGISTETAVHEARKAMKRVRAVLRLVRDTIGDPVYRPENAVLRDTARRLGGARDAAVLEGVLDTLTERFAGRLWPGAYTRLREHLADNHTEHERMLDADAQLLVEVIFTLKAARVRYAAWRPIVVDDDFVSVRRGLRRVYRRGRRTMDVAIRRPSAVSYHEWRKRVKYLRYQVEVLRRLWPDLMEGLATSLAQLAEDLGTDHDLSVLADVVRANPGLVPRYHDRDLLLTVIEGRRAELQTEARRLGRLIYLESPDVFVDRIGAYWAAAH